MGLDGDHILQWDNYTSELVCGHIYLSKPEDELIWTKNETCGVYAPNLGYLSDRVEADI